MKINTKSNLRITNFNAAFTFEVVAKDTNFPVFDQRPQLAVQPPKDGNTTTDLSISPGQTNHQIFYTRYSIRNLWVSTLRTLRMQGQI